MNSLYIKNIIRFLLFIIIQVLILKRIDTSFGNFTYIHLIIFPAALMLLPIKTPRAIIILLGFVLGIVVDAFYDSPGVHASAMVMMAFSRDYILKYLEPQGGYSGNQIPSINHFDLAWYLIYSSVMMSIYFIMYFSMEAFSFVYIVDILLNTIFSFILSMPIILLHQFIFNPKV